MFSINSMSQRLECLLAPHCTNQISVHFSAGKNHQVSLHSNEPQPTNPHQGHSMAYFASIQTKPPDLITTFTDIFLRFPHRRPKSAAQRIKCHSRKKAMLGPFLHTHLYVRNPMPKTFGLRPGEVHTDCPAKAKWVRG